MFILYVGHIINLQIQIHSIILSAGTVDTGPSHIKGLAHEQSCPNVVSQVAFS